MKKLSFYIIALLIPVVLLLIAEMVLRAVDFRAKQPLFIDHPQQKAYLQPNEKVIQRFFPAPEMAPNVSPDTQFFRKVKQSNSFRIVVQGGSTAAGFPYGRWGSLSGMLQQRFKRLYPNKNIEIINTAMASVNTYTLLDFVDEIIEIEPDLVIIYAGHNEYLGIMGVGSAYASRGGRAANLLYLALKDWQIYRAVESLYYSIASGFEDNTNAKNLNDRTLMASIAKDKEIIKDDEVFLAGIEQFAGNLNLILDKYANAAIPVILGDLVSNEKDHVPFSALDDISNDELNRIASLSESERGNMISNIQLNLSNHKSTNIAADNYRLAYALLKSGQTQKAKNAFIEAKDYDNLRFRAPTAFNHVIKNLTQRPKVFLAAVDDAFVNDSTDGIIGSKLMLEHLHPSVRGYFVLSNAYIEAMIENNLLPKSNNDDLLQAWQEQPVSLADEAYGQFKVDRLVADYPFTTEKKNVELPRGNTLETSALRMRVEGKGWLAINQQLLTSYQKQKNGTEAAKVAGLMADALPFNAELTYVAGMLYKQTNNLLLSTHHLVRAIDLEPKNVQARLSLAQNYFIQGDKGRSLDQLEQVKLIQPDHPQVHSFIKRVTKL